MEEFTNKTTKLMHDFLNNDLIKNNHREIFIGIIITVLFIVLAIIVYNKYIKPLLDTKYVPNKEFIPDQNNNIINLYYFYTTWCPYCKKARPEWDKFKEEIENNKLLNETYNIQFNEVDCDENKNLAKEYKIEGYPTIKLEKNNKIYDYDAKPDSTILMKFFNESL